MKQETKELVKAYLDGVEIEYKGASLDFAHCPWNNVESLALFERDDLMFRRKPVAKKSVGYKRYLYQHDGFLYVGLQYECEVEDPIEEDELAPIFLDKEWQYAEYVENER